MEILNYCTTWNSILPLTFGWMPSAHYHYLEMMINFRHSSWLNFCVLSSSQGICSSQQPGEVGQTQTQNITLIYAPPLSLACTVLKNLNLLHCISIGALVNHKSNKFSHLNGKLIVLIIVLKIFV